MSNNNNPLWVSVSRHVNTLEERRKILLENKRNIEEQISEIEYSIALLQLLSPPSAESITSADGSQTNINLPSSQNANQASNATGTSLKISGSNTGQVSYDPLSQR